MFVNLIDMDLQNQIAIANDLNSDVAEALKLLLEEAPTEMITGLQDWKLETTEGQNILFYKGRNYIPKDIELCQDIVKTFHDHETAGHPGEIGMQQDPNVCGHGAATFRKPLQMIWTSRQNYFRQRPPICIKSLC